MFVTRDRSSWQVYRSAQPRFDLALHSPELYPGFTNQPEFFREVDVRHAWSPMYDWHTNYKEVSYGLFFRAIGPI